MTATLNTSPRHPSRFSDPILALIAELISPGSLVLDPFAGTGRIHELAQRCGISTVGVEIEPEWAAMPRGTLVGDALSLPFTNATFDVVATSPCYGNRFADHHHAKDGSVRRSYTHDLGRPVHPNSAGTLQWGAPYRRFHQAAWAEVLRVLRPGGRIILNVSDHVRRGAIQPVTDWHLGVLEGLGLTLLARHEVPTSRMRYGANHQARVNHETVAVLTKGESSG